ncbi:MAG TPA: tetratricopeptide repeat protein [Terriglobia bacterium]|nr:tetratricopeptide repeat protein [Terriglobia bacterium]
MRLPHKPVLFVLLVLILSVPSRAGAATVADISITGRLVFDNGDFGPEATAVTLMQGGATVATSYTDGSGYFAFRNIRPGAYIIHVEADGFEEVNQPLDLLERSWGTNTNIMLTRTRKVIRRGQSSTVDVSEFHDKYPKKAVDAFRKGVENRKLGKKDEATKNFEAAVKLAPEFYEAHNELGVLYQAAGRTDDAENEFLRAHYLNNSNADPLVNLTSLYLEENKPDLALTTGEQAVKANSRSAPAFFNLGMALYKLARLDKAEVALKKALELAPKMAQVRLMLANVYLKLRHYDSLMDQLDSYLKENPKGEQRKAVEDMRESLLKAKAEQQQLQ